MIKKIILIIVVVVVIGLIAWGVWFFAFSRSSGPNAAAHLGSLPSVQGQAQNGTIASVQGVSGPQNPQVVNDFLGEIQNANQIALGGTVVVPPYALQVWGDTNKGGEALLEYASSTGWTLISLGGGEWSVLSLIQEGVPVSVAEQLVAGLTNGTSAIATSSVAIPAGDTIAIGTPRGVVTMNNFYNNAAYIDQNERVVVIQQNSTYGIFYDISGSNFKLAIFRTPSKAVRQAAEAGFLASLGISQQDACRLNPYETFPEDVSATSNQHSLSFCSGAF